MIINGVINTFWLFWKKYHKTRNLSVKSLSLMKRHGYSWKQTVYSWIPNIMSASAQINDDQCRVTFSWIQLETYFFKSKSREPWPASSLLSVWACNLSERRSVSISGNEIPLLLSFAWKYYPKIRGQKQNTTCNWDKIRVFYLRSLEIPIIHRLS